MNSQTKHQTTVDEFIEELGAIFESFLYQDSGNTTFSRELYPTRKKTDIQPYRIYIRIGTLNVKRSKYNIRMATDASRCSFVTFANRSDGHEKK